MNGGSRVAEVLKAHGVPYLFTLVGGHISPILVESKKRGIRVVDVRDEVNAVFAADAVARLTGKPGVAAVTAGPGVTNCITAIKNAQMAQSPVIVIGGATATATRPWLTSRYRSSRFGQTTREMDWAPKPPT